jgi:hypothetical protein
MIGTLLLIKAAHYAMVQIQVLEAWLAPISPRRKTSPKRCYHDSKCWSAIMIGQDCDMFFDLCLFAANQHDVVVAQPCCGIFSYAKRDRPGTVKQG